MRLIGGWLNHRCAAGFCAIFERVRVCTKQAQLGPGAPRPTRGQTARQRMLVVGVVGVEHELKTVQLQRREVSIGIALLRAEHLFVEL